VFGSTWWMSTASEAARVVGATRDVQVDSVTGHPGDGAGGPAGSVPGDPVPDGSASGGSASGGSASGGSVPGGPAGPDAGPIVVGRIGRPHGVRGDVTVDVRTDVPDRRFTIGARLLTDRPARPELVVDNSHWHAGTLLVRFAGVDDRGAAEALRGVIVSIDAAAAGAAADADEPDADDVFWDRDLVGLRATTVGGEDVGIVTDVVHTAAGELLAIERPDGREALVPFVRDIVPVVEPARGRLVLDPPVGLLDLGTA
jgi:16S rRNA processing protein RimM